MRQSFYTNGDKPDEVYLNVVMDYIQDTAYRVMKNYLKMKQMVPNLIVKLYSYQLLRSIAYIHAKGICHRDIKPQNILCDTQSHVLKLCDFGSAKQLIKRAKRKLHLFALLQSARANLRQFKLWHLHRCVVRRLRHRRINARSADFPRRVRRRPTSRNYQDTRHALERGDPRDEPRLH